MATYSSAVVVLLALCLLFTVSHIVLQRIRRARWIKAEGLKGPWNLIKTKERFIGWDFIVETMKASREFRYLDLICDRHDRYGHTYVAHRLLYQTISTRDPENLKQSSYLLEPITLVLVSSKFTH